MGLGAPKRRTKLSRDPNNTAWSKRDNTYGHRILSAQGWKPGDYLGASNANHSDHYTAANASHIRVLLREENLGLGAQIGKSNAETFGLSLFSGVLGRLNGKSDEEVQRQQEALRDAELRNHCAQKYGVTKFVRGGWLVGDEIEPVKMESSGTDRKPATTSSMDKEGTKSKKRKAEESSNAEDEKKSKSNRRRDGSKDSALLTHERLESVKQRDLNKGKRSSAHERVVIDARRSAAQQDNRGDQASLDAKDGSRETRRAVKKSDEKRHKKARRKDEGSKALSESTAEDDRSRRKQEKHARKEERRERRDKSQKEASSSSEQDEASFSEKVESTITSSTPSNGSRLAVRQRYIQQKRMASLDPQAMKEILMLKAAG